MGARMQTACGDWRSHQARRIRRPPAVPLQLAATSWAGGCLRAVVAPTRGRVPEGMCRCRAADWLASSPRIRRPVTRSTAEKFPPSWSRACLCDWQWAGWQLENILQDRPVVNLHRANEASFLFDRAAELRGGANVFRFRPTKKNSGCLF